MNRYKSLIEKLVDDTGISINGTNPQDIQVYQEDFYKRVLKESSLGLGESYMEKWWEVEAIDDFLFRLFKSGIVHKVKKNWQLLFLLAKARIFNLQTQTKARKSIAYHYDIGNDLYQKMLDPLMQYSCGYWKNAQNLTEAQEHKLKLICEKLKLKPGQTLLDVGCGWGGLAFYAAKNYGAKVVGITLSKAQKEIAHKRCAQLPVEIRFQDYRDLDEKFDRIVSVGMFEHVGSKNYAQYMETMARCLAHDGICLLSFIGATTGEVHTDPWIHKYIFPNGSIPSIQQLGKAIEGKWVMQDVHNIGKHYDKTLMAWIENFKTHWHELNTQYDDTFYRMWLFYLASSAASFRARRLHLWQIVLLKPKFCEEYVSVRF